jgi:APA family basic amino acid/polyamine antiporter
LSNIDESDSHELKREVGSWGSFAMGYADVGADIYIAVGFIAAYAGSAAPLALAIAAVTYVCTGLCYAELATAFPVAGGGHFYAMKAFGNVHGFMAGWGLMLDYTIDMALFSLATVGYLSVLLRLVANNSVLGLSPYYGFTAIALILILLVLNVAGIKYSSRFNEVIVAADLITITVFLAFGLPYVVSSGLLASWFSQVVHSFSFGIFGNPSLGWYSFAYAVSLAMVSYIGIESISQAAEETKNPAKVIPKATKRAIISVVVIALSLSLLSVSLFPWQVVASGDNQSAPLVPIARGLPIIGSVFYIWIGIMGVLICYISTNTGVIGASRVTFSMGKLGLLPKGLSRVSARFRTPYVTVIVFPLIASLILLVYSVLPNADLLDLVASLYNYGALVAYMYVNLAAIVLRIKEPGERAWKMPLNFHINRNARKYEISIIPVFGFAASLTVWFIIVGTHPVGRILGTVWFGIGLAGYLLYRWRLKRNGR